MDNEILEMTIADIEVGLVPKDVYQPLKIYTNRGDISCRYYHAPGAKSAVVYIGSETGGFDSPAHNLYHRLPDDLILQRVSGLRLSYRYPGDLLESVLDTIAGITFLQSIGIERISIIGHSFGGAVAIQSAAICTIVNSVVTLSSQSLGTETVADLSPRCSVLILHGTADNVFSPSSSLDIHEMAGQPKQIIIYDGARHELDEAAPGVYKKVRSWLLSEFKKSSS